MVQGAYLNKIRLQLPLLFQEVYLSIIQHIFQFKYPYEYGRGLVQVWEYLYLGKRLFLGVFIINPTDKLSFITDNIT